MYWIYSTKRTILRWSWFFWTNTAIFLEHTCSSCFAALEGHLSLKLIKHDTQVKITPKTESRHNSLLFLKFLYLRQQTHITCKLLLACNRRFLGGEKRQRLDFILFSQLSHLTYSGVDWQVKGQTLELLKTWRTLLIHNNLFLQTFFLKIK